MARNTMTILQEALIAVMEEEAAAYESAIAKTPEHTFSRRYERRKNQIIRLAEQRLTGSAHESHRRAVRRVRIRTLLVAALILLFTVATVVAIVKPEIYYIIKEKITNWEISFGVSPEEETTDSIDFEVIRPLIPEGFTVVEEDEETDLFFLRMRNDVDNDVDITFTQSLPEGMSIQLDSERSDNSIEYIDDKEVVVSRRAASLSMVFNNGEYVFMIEGNCNESILREMAEEILSRK